MSDRDDPLAAADAEAAVWLARLHADDKSEADEQAFRGWLRTDPAHQAAFDHLTQVWEAAGAVPRMPYEPEPSGARRIGRRELVFGAAVLAVGVAGTGYWQSAVAGVYETGLGEQKHATLSDGSLIFLDTDSKIRVRFSSTERLIELLRGRCNFRVAPDAARPFVVEAAEQRISAPRATFDVRRDAGGVQVVCIDGNAAIGTERGPGAAQLKTGERLIADAGAPPRIDAPDLNAATSWQSGQLIFDDQPLAEAVAELNRYSDAKLVVADPRVASLRLSGVYRIGDNVAFARSVAQLLPVRVEQAGTDIRLIGAR